MFSLQKELFSMFNLLHLLMTTQQENTNFDILLGNRKNIFY